ncbi:FkbM family methyltransferase [Tabrizicola sp.]|uniref:FkbM family methyltransferase n=1 Tax=Tabrizicola sp. TaxID=2005166 RepID=UPI002FDDDDA6
MIRDLGPYIPKRAHKLDAPILTMLLNGVHDHHRGQVFVLQVGAGNGETGLPLLPRFQDDGWSGLLIEPHPQNFAQLDALHANGERVAVLNLGISDVSASLPLHSLTPEAEARNRRAPRRRASLIRDRIATPGILPEDIASTEVPFLRMDTVLTELGIDSAQIIAINAGGHEAQVLSSFDPAAFGPSLVLVHSSPGTAADDACIAALTAANLHPFRIAGWLAGLAPTRLAVPLEELLTFFRTGIGAPQDPEE